MSTYDWPQYTYDNSGILYNGKTYTTPARATYSVVIRGFADTTDFGPGDVIAFVANPTNLAWTEYINLPGEAFFTLRQDDPLTTLLRDYIDIRPHMQIYRNGQIVWGGWLGETDETLDDVVFYGYSYLSGLYDLITAWDVSWTSANVSTIISDMWTRAHSTLAKSRMRWMTTGIIQSLWSSDAQDTVLTLALYKASYKRLLTGMAELAAFSISDTSNHVVFEITPTGTFNLWSDRDTARDSLQWSLGNGKVREFHRFRRPVDRRTVLYGVGLSPTDVLLNKSKTATTLYNAMGRSEEPIAFSYVRDDDELSRVLLTRKKRASRVDTDLTLTFYRDLWVPFRANDSDYNLGDTVQIELNHGITNISDTKVVVGQQIIWYRQSENVKVLLGDTF